MFGVEKRLHPEAATDIFGDHPDAARVDLEHACRQQIAHQPDALRVGGERPALGAGVVLGGGRARLHAGDHDAVVDDAAPYHMRGGGEQRVASGAIADLPVEADIVRRIGPDQLLPVLHGFEQVDDRIDDLVFDADRLGAVCRRLRRARNHEGDRVADMAHHAVGQHRMRRVLPRRAVAVGQLHRAGHRADAVGREVARRVGRHHARERQRRGDIDRDDPRRRVRAAQHDAMKRTGPGRVVGVAAGAAKQARILDPSRPCVSELFHPAAPRFLMQRPAAFESRLGAV